MAKMDLVTNEELKLRIEEKLAPLIEEINRLKKEVRPTEYLNVTETASLLGITPFTVRKYTKEGLLVRYRIGTQVRYKRSEIIDAIKMINSPKVK